jgi:hypothetical protein
VALLITGQGPNDDRLPAKAAAWQISSVRDEYKDAAAAASAVLHVAVKQQQRTVLTAVGPAHASM